MYKIDNDEDLQIDIKELYENYNDYLNKDLRKILKKILNTKPEFITDKERDIIEDFYENMNNLVETMVQIRYKIDLIH
jgi:hypothetical protein